MPSIFANKHRRRLRNCCHHRHHRCRRSRRQYGRVTGRHCQCPCPPRKHRRRRRNCARGTRGRRLRRPVAHSSATADVPKPPRAGTNATAAEADENAHAAHAAAVAHLTSQTVAPPTTPPPPPTQSCAQYATPPQTMAPHSRRPSGPNQVGTSIREGLLLKRGSQPVHRWLHCLRTPPFHSAWAGKTSWCTRGAAKRAHVRLTRGRPLRIG